MDNILTTQSGIRMDRNTSAQSSDVVSQSTQTTGGRDNNASAYNHGYRTYKLTLEYNGSNYQGFQRQQSSHRGRALQGHHVLRGRSLRARAPPHSSSTGSWARWKRWSPSTSGLSRSSPFGMPMDDGEPSMGKLLSPTFTKSLKQSNRTWI